MLSANYHACLGIKALGLCAYDPSSPAAVYFGLGEAVAALGFILAVQQLLKPIYSFRLNTRRISITQVYILVFFGVVATAIAAVLPTLPLLQSVSGPLGYPIVWELLGGALCVFAYGAVVVAILRPARFRPGATIEFVRASGRLLSQASEQDQIDFSMDLAHCLPNLVRISAFDDAMDETSAFFDFTNRREFERASYARSLLRILADPQFCRTLVSKVPWRVAAMVDALEREQLHSRGAEQFIRELARQAIVADTSMVEREIGYHGFGTAPLLSSSLFSRPFVVRAYDPLDSFRYMTGDDLSPEVLRRFNAAAKKALTCIIDGRHIWHEQVAYSIHDYYESVFRQAASTRARRDEHRLVFEMNRSVKLVIEMADKLLAEAPSNKVSALYIEDVKNHTGDVLETLVDTIYEALASISNEFRGIDDVFWLMAIHTFQSVFPSIGEQPAGMTPLQQRLALKIVRKLKDNMDGYYPAISRVLLACMGPYRENEEPNRGTAFSLLKDAVYVELQRMRELAESKPERIADYLPDNVSYDPKTTELTHTYRLGRKATTNLSTLKIKPISLISPIYRRQQDKTTDN